MATFVVCTRCSKTQEIDAIDQFPNLWQRTDTGLLCPRCARANVLDEETRDESFEECEICRGPCQGH